MPTEKELDAMWEERLLSELGENWRTIEKAWFEGQKHTWKRYNAGAIHLVYINPESSLVLKIPIRSTMSLHEVQRKVRLWDLANPNAAAEVIFLNHGRWAWACPFVDGKYPTPIQIRNALLKIYKETGRILIDSIIRENFLCTKDGEVHL